MQVYYKFMNVHWMVVGNQDVIDARIDYWRIILFVRVKMKR